MTIESTGDMTTRHPTPLSTLRLAPSPKLHSPTSTPSLIPDVPATGNPDVLLRQIMGFAHIALLDAWCEPLQVISFTTATGERSAFGLNVSQTETGASWYENVYPPDHARLRAFLQRSTETGRNHSSVDYRLIVGDGELLWVRHWILSRAITPKGRWWWRAAVMAIPEQKHLEWECLRVSERECNRIGQELHDDLCQVLAGLTFMMRVVAQHSKQIDATLGAEIDEMNGHVIAATDRVRSMAHGLFPAQLNYRSLREALTSYAVEARTLFRIQINVQLPTKLPRHNPEQIIQLYRIVQEAVSNAVRHGAATAVRITLQTTRLGIELSIEDNGTGFPAASARPEGIGLHIMEYRARVLGGTLDFRNLLPRGMAVQLTYPIAQVTPKQSRKLIATP